MTPPAASSPSIPISAEHSSDKRRAALHSMLAAAAMTSLKLAAGILSGSLGVLSDAAHSGLDLAGATLTFFSVRVSDKPADEDHTYGHGKVENLSAFVEAGLMAISCAWIIWEAVIRIVRDTFELRHSIWPVLVIITSITVDFWRSRKLRAVAEKTGSPALATDAFHFASDIWASVAVLAGLAATWAGIRTNARSVMTASATALNRRVPKHVRRSPSNSAQLTNCGRRPANVWRNFIGAASRRRIFMATPRVRPIPKCIRSICLSIALPCMACPMNHSIPGCI